MEVNEVFFISVNKRTLCCNHGIKANEPIVFKYRLGVRKILVCLGDNTCHKIKLRENDPSILKISMVP